MSDTTLTREQIDAAELADWTFLLGELHARFRTANFATGLQFVNQVGAAAEAADHHPDLDLRYGFVDVTLSSHDAHGITNRDIELARTISDVASGLGVGAAPAEVAAMELALDTPDFTKIKPFWLAALGYSANPDSDDEVRDKDGRFPTIWFQGSGSDEPRQRFHIDIRVPKDVARQRVEAAVAAGGTVVTEAATFTTLQDGDGNNVCICI